MEKCFDIIKDFLPLFDDLLDPSSYPDNKPLLAHYTSIEILERIMTTDEVWFSNPLFMNDIEECSGQVKTDNWLSRFLEISELLFKLSRGKVSQIGMKAVTVIKHFNVIYDIPASLGAG